jgi:processive 1,2-diacylglycerol beta-glucosyltransferase
MARRLLSRDSILRSGGKARAGGKARTLAPQFTRAPRVLVLSASVGAGHVRAAQALEAAFNAGSFPGEARHLDVLATTNPAFRGLYSKGYLELVNKAPTFLGWLYDRTDVPWKSHRLQDAFEKLNLVSFVRLLADVCPAWAVCTHFLPAGIIQWLRQEHGILLPQAVVVTDFDAHAFWFFQHVEHYFVAREEARVYLARGAVPPERISVTGIPIDPVFATPKDKTAMRRKHGLAENLSTLLLSVGGFGLDIAERILESLLALPRPVQVVAAAGKSAEVRARLERVAAGAPPAHRIHILGFTTEMDELMAAADLLIGKAGGLTSSEALARDLPLVIVNPIPGQEERNSDHLLEVGAAIRCNSLPTLAWKVEGLLSDPARLARLREAARQAAHPRAALDVVEKMTALLRAVPPEGLPAFPAPEDGEAGRASRRQKRHPG